MIVRDTTGRSVPGVRWRAGPCRPRAPPDMRCPRGSACSAALLSSMSRRINIVERGCSPPPACGGPEGRVRHHAHRRTFRAADRDCRVAGIGPLPSAARAGQGPGRTARRAVARRRPGDPQPRRPRRLQSVTPPPIALRSGSRPATLPPLHRRLRVSPPPRVHRRLLIGKRTHWTGKHILRMRPKPARPRDRRRDPQPPADQPRHARHLRTQHRDHRSVPRASDRRQELRGLRSARLRRVGRGGRRQVRRPRSRAGPDGLRPDGRAGAGRSRALRRRRMRPHPPAAAGRSARPDDAASNVPPAEA